MIAFVFFFQAEDGIRYLVRSRGLGDVYKRQVQAAVVKMGRKLALDVYARWIVDRFIEPPPEERTCLLYTSDAADERSSVDLGGRRIIKKKNSRQHYK